MPVQHSFRRGARKALGVAAEFPQQNARQSSRCAYLFMMSIASPGVERIMYALYGQNLRVLRDDEKYQLTRTTMLNFMLLAVSTLQLVAVSSMPLTSIIIYLASVWFFVYFMEAARQMCLQRANANPNSTLTKVCVPLRVIIMQPTDPSLETRIV
ncbi:hypothetical protein FRC12_002529 [Ceratobasidium sp. 428]|nr:hypothetical protein FRC12_002529 [Ceratobasidium sp. 428]